MDTIETDYLVVGAGAMGMAFTDTLVCETQARVVLVDRNHQPGRALRAVAASQLRWLDDPGLGAWLSAAWLDILGHLMGHLLAPASAKPRVRDRILSVAESALSATATKLDQLMLDEARCNPTRY